MLEELVIGLDIGGTNTLIGLVDKYANVKGKIEIKTQNYATAEEFSHKVTECIHELMQQNKKSVLKGIGIGAPNGNYLAGTIEYAPNLPWKGVVHLAAMLKKDLLGVLENHPGTSDFFSMQQKDFAQFPVLLTNDANAAAIGEMAYGHAVNIRDFIFITLGTGLGSGIVVDGQLVYGHDGFAGEIGHVIMVSGGRLCGCGNHGCLETYCSSTGVKRTYIELCEKYQKPIPVPIDTLNSLYVYERALEGDAIALETFEFTAELLGLALANSAKYTSPEAIFLFGGLSYAADLLFKPMIQHFQKNLLPIHRNKIKILFSGLHQGDVAILGAASLVWKQRTAL